MTHPKPDGAQPGTDKWKGVERLASGMATGLDSGHREPTAEEKFAYMALKLRERLEPLLEAADMVRHMSTEFKADFDIKKSLLDMVATWR